MGVHQVVDYYYKDQFIFKLGYVNHDKASKPLALHAHREKTEFIFMVKGRQNYMVDEKPFLVQSGEVFKILPGELHSTGSIPEEKSELFYMSIDLKAAATHELLCVGTDSEKIQNWHKKRCWRTKNQMYDYCHDILNLCQQKNGMWETEVRNKLSSLFIDMYRETPETFDSKKTSMNEVMNYIETHIQEEITLEQLLTISGFSRSRFHHYFLKEFRIPPSEYILRLKMEHAKKELRNSQKTITAIAHEFSFSSSQYFSTVFKRYCYMSPSEFRQNKILSTNEEAYYE